MDPSHGLLTPAPHTHTTPGPERSTLPGVRGLPAPRSVSAGGCLWHKLVSVPGAVCGTGSAPQGWCHPWVSDTQPEHRHAAVPSSFRTVSPPALRQINGRVWDSSPQLVVLRPSTQEHEVTPLWHLEGPPRALVSQGPHSRFGCGIFLLRNCPAPLRRALVHHSLKLIYSTQRLLTVLVMDYSKAR